MVKCPFKLNSIPPYNVLDYGTDRAAFQACIDAASAAGRRVYAGPGTYTLAAAGGQDYSLLLPSNIYIYGAGASSILSSSAKYPIRIIGKTGITLKDFALDSSYSVTDQAGIEISGTNSGFLFENLTVTDMYYTGINSIAGATLSASTIRGCSVTHCGNFGIFISGGTGTLIDACTCSDFPRTDLYPPHGIYLTDCVNFILRDCVTNGPLGNKPSGISGVQAMNCTNLLLDGCSAANCDTGSDGYGWLCGDGGSYTLTDCTSGGGNEKDMYEYNGGSFIYNGMAFPPLTKRVWP